MPVAQESLLAPQLLDSARLPPSILFLPSPLLFSQLSTRMCHLSSKPLSLTLGLLEFHPHWLLFCLWVYSARSLQHLSLEILHLTHWQLNPEGWIASVCSWSHKGHRHGRHLFIHSIGRCPSVFNLVCLLSVYRLIHPEMLCYCCFEIIHFRLCRSSLLYVFHSVHFYSYLSHFFPSIFQGFISLFFYLLKLDACSLILSFSYLLIQIFKAINISLGTQLAIPSSFDI